MHAKCGGPILVRHSIQISHSIMRNAGQAEPLRALPTQSPEATSGRSASVSSDRSTQWPRSANAREFRPNRVPFPSPFGLKERRITIARYSAAIMPWTSHTAWRRRNSGPLDETGRRFSCPQRCVGGEAARLTTDLGDCIPVSTSAASRGSACREPTGPDKQRFTQRSDGQPNGCRTCADLEHDQRPVKRRREAAQRD